MHNNNIMRDDGDNDWLLKHCFIKLRALINGTGVDPNPILSAYEAQPLPHFDHHLPTLSAPVMLLSREI